MVFTFVSTSFLMASGTLGIGTGIGARRLPPKQLLLLYWSNGQERRTARR